MKYKIRSLIIMNHCFAGLAFVHFKPTLLPFAVLGWLLFGKIGGEVGLHRYFAHRSFKTTALVDAILTVSASYNCIGSPLSWAALHRYHHLHSDTNLDPHGKLSLLRVWMTFWRRVQISPRLSIDLVAKPFHRWVHNNYFFLILGTFAFLAIPNIWLPVYLISIPSILTFHSAGLVNTICHRFGYQRFPTGDNSRNNLLVNMLTLGSGLHNNHHAQPSNWKNSHAWFEFDLPASIIYLLKVDSRE